jgi:hypothetical protein
MALTMNDPPRFDLRSVPVVAGAVVAVLALARIKPFGALPFNAVVLCLAGLSGALVARGTAYPGRFSIHLIPVTVALFVCAVSLVLRVAKTPPTSRHKAVLVSAFCLLPSAFHPSGFQRLRNARRREAPTA